MTPVMSRLVALCGVIVDFAHLLAVDPLDPRGEHRQSHRNQRGDQGVGKGRAAVRSRDNKAGPLSFDVGTQTRDRGVRGLAAESVDRRVQALGRTRDAR